MKYIIILLTAYLISCSSQELENDYICGPESATNIILHHYSHKNQDFVKTEGVDINIEKADFSGGRAEYSCRVRLKKADVLLLRTTVDKDYDIEIFTSMVKVTISTYKKQRVLVGQKDGAVIFILTIDENMVLSSHENMQKFIRDMSHRAPDSGRL